MQVQFLSDARAERELLRLIGECESMAWAIAWATPNRVLDAAVRSADKFTALVIGTHMYQTSPEVLRTMAACPALRVMPPTGKLFHPKAYLFRLGQQVVAVVGSHNLTKSAMRHNTEASMLLSGHASDEALVDLTNFIHQAQSNAKVLRPDFLYRYELLYLAKANARRELEEFETTAVPPNPNSPLAPFTLTWPWFVQEISRPRENGPLDERLRVLRRAQQLFHEFGSLSKMPIEGRRAIAGTLSKREALSGDTDFLLFGSMRNGSFAQAISKHPEALSQALDCIPFDRRLPVMEMDFAAYWRLFELACVDMEHKGSISTASRLLAMKRPDVFVCKSGENVERLAYHFGCAKSFGAKDYWSKIVRPMMETSWWKTSRPNDQREVEIWSGRAALLDVLYWVGKKRQLPASSA